MNAPSRPDASIGTPRKRGKLIAVLVLVATLIAVPLVRYAWSESKREDSPERYARLCTLLFSDLPADKAVPTPKATEAEQTVRLHDLRQELENLSQECRRLAPIADDVKRELDTLSELSKRLPSFSKLVLNGVETAVGFGLKSTDMLESGSKGTLHELKGYAEIGEAVMASRSRIKVARVRLAEMAPAYSGPITQQPILEAEFTEEAPSLFGQIFSGPRTDAATQTLGVRNTSGRTLNRCVITVRLSVGSEKSFQSLYYVDSWPSGEWHKVTYLPHDWFSETNVDVDRAQIKLWSAELTAPMLDLFRKGETWPYTK